MAEARRRRGGARSRDWWRAREQGRRRGTTELAQRARHVVARAEQGWRRVMGGAKAWHNSAAAERGGCSELRSKRRAGSRDIEAALDDEQSRGEEGKKGRRKGMTCGAGCL